MLGFGSVTWMCINICVFSLVSLVLDTKYKGYIHSVGSVLYLNIEKKSLPPEGLTYLSAPEIVILL